MDNDDDVGALPEEITAKSITQRIMIIEGAVGSLKYEQAQQRRRTEEDRRERGEWANLIERRSREFADQTLKMEATATKVVTIFEIEQGKRSEVVQRLDRMIETLERERSARTEALAQHEQASVTRYKSLDERVRIIEDQRREEKGASSAMDERRERWRDRFWFPTVVVLIGVLATALITGLVISRAPAQHSGHDQRVAQ